MSIKTQGDELGELLYELLSRNGLELLKIDRSRLRKKLGSEMGVHRSNIHRIFDWVEIEIELNQPHRTINEFTARTLKKKVRKEAWSSVLERVQQNKGGGQKITSQDVLATAQELGCLKGPPVRETDIDAGESSPSGDEYCETAQTTKRSAAVVERSKQAASDQQAGASSDSADVGMDSDPLVRVLDRLRSNRGLRRAVIGLLAHLDKQWVLVSDLVALGAKERSKLRKRLEDLG